jgi:hypothetical protein
MEFRSDNPGINEGDMFIANDPWVGAAHQQDVMLLCPVFWEGELFCWVTNCLHQYDIGGITPGIFFPSAESAYDEGIMLPPIKIIEGGEIRRDITRLQAHATHTLRIRNGDSLHGGKPRSGDEQGRTQGKAAKGVGVFHERYRAAARTGRGLPHPASDRQGNREVPDQP